jgi:hypothetical protein
MGGLLVGGTKALIILERCREFIPSLACSWNELKITWCWRLTLSQHFSSSLCLFSLCRYIDSSHTELIRVGSLDPDKG